MSNTPQNTPKNTITLRDLFRVMIVDHDLAHIEEMQKTDFAKAHKIKPYFVYYGSPVENLPEGVRQFETLEDIVAYAGRHAIQGVVSDYRREDEPDIYGVTLAKKLRALEPEEKRNNPKKRMPIALHGNCFESLKAVKKNHEDIFDALTITGSDLEYMTVSDMLASQQKRTLAHIVTHNLNYDPGSAKILGRAPRLNVTPQFGLSPDQLKSNARMIKTGVDGVLLGVYSEQDLQPALDAAKIIQEKKCEVALVWTAPEDPWSIRTDYHNGMPKKLAERAASAGVSVIDKHEMGLWAARIEQQKTGYPKNPVFLRRSENGSWRNM